ncbi:hypothetical protein ACRQ5Q_14475 [Bradyrhizobium sp. PMVTL-01]|uniref:hypothetical protein n=1 Tax=Bradyrhizobium sp. PMVTL-01 TaxID=3434999 RepID=UPI003F6EB4E7
MTAYPNSPGYKENGTSKDAARNIESQAKRDRDEALGYIRGNPGKTADEVAEALNKSILSIRPRISELKTAGLVTKSGRGTNASGHSAYRWRATTTAEQKDLPPPAYDPEDPIDF